MQAEAELPGTATRAPITAGSIPSVVMPLVSVLVIPAPGCTTLVPRKARRSVPPAVSQAPFVADHRNSGTESAGNEATPLCATQLPEQLTAKLWPTISAPEET